MILLDTDVLIESLRGTPAAKKWLQKESSESFYIPGVAAMELVAGARDKTELERIQDFLRSFSIV